MNTEGAYSLCRICGMAAKVSSPIDVGDHQHHSVLCPDCGVEVCRLSKDEAREVWNRLMSPEGA